MVLRTQVTSDIPRIEAITIRNYRCLRNLVLRELTPLTVFLGPNGSGKSTVFDVFAFLSECFTDGLRRAWDKRGRFRELMSRGVVGNIEIELKFRERPGTGLVTYHIAIGEDKEGPYVAEEWLRWKRGSHGRPFSFLDFKQGKGIVIPGDQPDESTGRNEEQLASREMLAVNTLGQFTKHPRVSALRRFIIQWHLSYLTANSARGVPEAGPQEQLSQSGDNLPNVMQYLKEQYPDILEYIQGILAERVPSLERVEAKLLEDGRLLLQIKDAPFDQPVLSKFTSDGTLKMLAYLVVLHGPHLSPLIGIEEPENQLHPSLLPKLAEECRIASEGSQLFVTTHSPFFIDALRPEEVWVLERDNMGYTQATRSSDMPGITEFIKQGATLGQLWTEEHFSSGYPHLRNDGERKGRSS